MASTYSADLAFLKKHTKIVELGVGKARVAVAPDYQGRVMTSTVGGAKAGSYGWINAKFIRSGAVGTAFDNYGGEDRFWLGPEGGQFALWFAAGELFDMDHWKTPAGFNSGKFKLASRTKQAVTLTARFDAANYSGTRFRCAVRRTVRMLVAADAAELLGVEVPKGVGMAGFASVNTLTNASKTAWTHDGGLLSVWILGQYVPMDKCRVIAPFNPGDDASLGVKVTTDYFGPLPARRGRIGGDHVLFAADGRYRSKIGVSPVRAKPVIGSYDPDASLLTIVQFNLPSGAARLPYVNSLWKMQDAPFAGDAINSYNDGEAVPGAGQLGPFYELETSSPAAELGPGRSITHVHRTFHFVGEPELLNILSRAVLGVDLGAIS